MLTSSQNLPLDINQVNSINNYQYQGISQPQYNTSFIQPNSSILMQTHIPPTQNNQGAYSQSNTNNGFTQMRADGMLSVANTLPNQQASIIQPQYNTASFIGSVPEQNGLPPRYMINQFPILQTSTRKGGGGRKRKPIDNLDEKKILFLERNRQAALKCRLRKKKNQETMMLKLQLLEQQNRQLEINRNSLSQQIQELSSLLNHHQYCPVYQSSIQNVSTSQGPSVKTKEN